MGYSWYKIHLKLGFSYSNSKWPQQVATSNFSSKFLKDCTKTGKDLRKFRKLGKSLAVLGILELSCQGVGPTLELSWQGLKSTGVSVREIMTDNNFYYVNSSQFISIFVFWDLPFERYLDITSNILYPYNKTGTSQVGAISKAQKYSRNNYWKHLKKKIVFFKKKYLVEKSHNAEKPKKEVI